jgi:hypothetical protein
MEVMEVIAVILDVALPYELDPTKLSFQSARVKAHTLELAPEGWFSQDYLKYRFESIDARFVGEGRVLEAAEEVRASNSKPSKKERAYELRSRMGL